MKAVVYTQYGSPDVLQLKEIEKPTPKDDEVLIRVRAVSVNYGDTLARHFSQLAPGDFNMPSILLPIVRMEFGYRKPKKQILGSEFAGDIEAVGKDVRLFKVGDAVFGYRGSNMGANAEYLCVAEDSLLAHKPSTMSYEEAATIPYGALTALNLFRKVAVQPGHKVLINGASGAIGSYALQLAKQRGAEVTGVCGTPRLEFVKALGADHVIDYTREDFTRNGEQYDLIFDILGRSSFAQCKRSLKPNGRYLLASFKLKQVFQMLWTSLTGSKKVICALSSETAEDLRTIKELAETGTITTLIDQCFPLEQTADAHRYVEAGKKRGNVVIAIQHNGKA